MNVLVDSSVWIDYFRTGKRSGETLEKLLDEGLIVINDLILSELLPSLIVQKQKALVFLLKEFERLPMKIDWDEIIKMQSSCLQSGINGIGIPDLMIAQNANQHDATLFTYDQHFERIATIQEIKLFS